MTDSDRTPKGCPWFSPIIIALGFVGTILSLFALQNHVAVKLDPEYQSFCNVGAAFNCNAVNASQYALLFGVPLAGYGVVFYGMIVFIGVVGIIRQRHFPDLGLIPNVILLLGAFAVLFSAYLFYIAEFVIGTMCLMCLGMYGVNLLLLILGWYAGRGEGIISRLLGSARVLLFSPVTLLGAGPYATRTGSMVALGGFLTLVALSLLTLRLPGIIEPYVTTKAPVGEESSIAVFVRQWENTPKITMPTSDVEGVSMDYGKGPLDAPVTFVEFSDFECPACRIASHAIDQALRPYEGKVRFIFKNFPLDKSCNSALEREMHRHACYGAHFARCAGEQQKFWDAAAYLFSLPELQGEQPYQEVRSAIDEGATALGLDTKAMGECMASDRHTPKIRSDITDGQHLGVEGTPSMWINGRKVPPTFNAEVLRAIIELALKE